MAVGLNALFNKRAIALTRAKLRAWWEGAPFDEAAALAALEAAPEANDNTADAEDALFDPPPYILPPRLAALGVLWGEGRVRPGDATAEALEPARLALAPDGVLAVLGPGLAGPLHAYGGVHAGRIDVFEWREETRDSLKHGVSVSPLAERVSVAGIDLEAHVFPPGSYDGLISIDDFAYCGYPPHLAQQIAKTLKAGACASVECYVGFKAAELPTAFASSFAEPQIRAHGDLLAFFNDAGLSLESDEDLTDEFLALAREAFKQLAEKLGEAAKLDVAAARELAWEAEAWRTRMRLLAQRRLERRRFILRKPAEAST